MMMMMMMIIIIIIIIIILCICKSFQSMKTILFNNTKDKVTYFG